MASGVRTRGKKWWYVSVFNWTEVEGGIKISKTKNSQSPSFGAQKP